ncbi:MAG: GGDEF domain-containing protein [Myxococcota bacterium]|nr:GGDEF domain-containing protein [Myxococcota bacterium]
MHLVQQDLNNINLFRGVQTDTIYGMLQSCPIRHIETEQTLISPGDESKCLFVVLEGKLRVQLENQATEPVIIVSKGDSVGELSLIDNQPRSAFVVATEASVVLEIDRQVFWRLANSFPGVAVNLLIILSARLRGNNDNIIESLKEQEKYRIHATVDGLTGLHNRRWLDEFLERQITRAKMAQQDLSVAMVDVDHFKSFNDTYGHQAGDFVLLQVAQRLSACLRPTDLTARYGGEEFTVIFPQTAIHKAEKAANRVREAVKALKLVTPDGVELPTITISLGVADISAAETMKKLIQHADQALYAAKESGRDRVCLSRVALGTQA